MHIDIDKGAAHMIEKIEERGFEAYIVGGCVRDSIMGRKPQDWDITTKALPQDVMDIFDRTIPTGIKHGTVTVLLEDRQYEVTTYRIDGDYLDSRRPSSVVFTRNIREDLSRRDFTINAMAYSPTRGLVDMFSGIDDIDNGIIRCVGDPDLRFKEDALRIMRAIRFSAQLGFDIEERTQKYIEENSLRLHNISLERVNDELEKIIKANPRKIENLNKLGGFVDKFFNSYRPTDQDIGLAVKIDDLGSIIGDKFLRYYFGCEDIKHSDKFVDLMDNHIKRAFLFYGMASDDFEAMMRNLRYSRKDIEASLTIHKFLKNGEYDYIFEEENILNLEEGEPVRSEDEKGDKAVRFEEKDLSKFKDEKSIRIGLKRIMSHIGDLSLAKNAILAKIIQKNLKAKLYFRVYNDIIESGECFSISQMKINGRFIVENNLARGPMVGNLLEKLLEHVIENPSDNEKDKLIEILKNIY